MKNTVFLVFVVSILAFPGCSGTPISSESTNIKNNDSVDLCRVKFGQNYYPYPNNEFELGEQVSKKQYKKFFYCETKIQSSTKIDNTELKQLALRINSKDGESKASLKKFAKIRRNIIEVDIRGADKECPKGFEFVAFKYSMLLETRFKICRSQQIYSHK